MSDRARVWCVIVLIALGSSSCGKGPPPDRLRVGGTFPELTLTTLEQGQDRLTSHRGRLVVLNVWATWCPPCRHELPSLAALQKALGPDRFEVVLMSVDSDPDIVREFLRHKGVDLESYIDPKQDNADRILGIRRYPDSFVISPEGGLVSRFVGETEWDRPELVAAMKKAAYNHDFNALMKYRDPNR